MSDEPPDVGVREQRFVNERSWVGVAGVGVGEGRGVSVGLSVGVGITGGIGVDWAVGVGAGAAVVGVVAVEVAGWAVASAVV